MSLVGRLFRSPVTRGAPMRQPTVKAWLLKSALRDMLVEADRVFPLETGGVMMGYWPEAGDEVVIYQVSGPGPLAVHSKHAFVPDGDYQEAEVARAYEESGRVNSYLGDWHTHPREGVYMSPKDKRTLLRIARSPGARAPVPLMAVLGGGDPDWFIGIWRYSRGYRRRLTLRDIISLEINFF